MYGLRIVGRLGWLFILTLGLFACAMGEIGGSPGGSTDPFGEPVDPASAPVCASANPDMSARTGWRTAEAEQPAEGVLHFEINARSTAPNLDGLVAVGAERIDDFDKAAIAVRFAEDGMVDARDSTSYASDTAYPYDPGVWYSIGITADVESRTYDVEIGPCGERREALIEDASFRDDTSVPGELSSWAVWSSQSAALEVSTPAWMPSGPSGVCVPATCDSLDQHCGQPGDGCGGKLNCGGCENNQICDSGRCTAALVEVPPAPTCKPDTCQGLALDCGVRSNGCGGYLDCGGCASGQDCLSGVCVDNSSPPPPPPPAPSGGRGPTGQWPQGFPAYATGAELTSNGTVSDLLNKMGSAACRDGCVIEHAGPIKGTITTTGNGPIVIRPPIGKRADYAIDGYTDVRGNDIVVAGYWANDNVSMNLHHGNNVGYAWIESDKGPEMLVKSHYGDCLDYGFWYEIVQRSFLHAPIGDRGGTRTSGGCAAQVDVVGSYITGSDAPSSQGYHADTFQTYSAPGTHMWFRDSIIWPSYDKILQGDGGDEDDFDLDNCLIMQPRDYAESLWPGGIVLRGYYWGSASSVKNSTIIGKNYPSQVQFQNNILYEAGTNWVDLGGNTVVTQMPTVPRPPTHTQLDAIWSP